MWDAFTKFSHYENLKPYGNRIAGIDKENYGLWKLHDLAIVFAIRVLIEY